LQQVVQYEKQNLTAKVSSELDKMLKQASKEKIQSINDYEFAKENKKNL